MDLDIKRVLQELAIELTQISNVEGCLQNREAYILGCLVNRCKVARTVPQVDFTLKPVLENNWLHWNSGGGCMIWSTDIPLLTDLIGSVHVTDEALLVASQTTNAYWELKGEEQLSTELSFLYVDDHPGIYANYLSIFGPPVSLSLTKDINSILNFI